MPISAALPTESTWWSNGKRALWRAIQRTAKDTSAFHLSIDAAAIAASGRRDEALVKWLMHRVATLRDRGLLRVETLRTTAARLSDVPATVPQRSILRAAA
jgi:hypothetical protein